jgi:hypothetical protein
MKDLFIYSAPVQIRLLILVFIAMWVLPPAECQEPIRSRFDLTCLQTETTIELRGLIRARIDRRYIGLPDLQVEFFAGQEDSMVELGQATTDENGIARLEVDRDNLMTDTSGGLYFSASFTGDDSYSASDGDLTITAAAISLEPVEIDSTYSLRARLTEAGNPVSGEDIYFFIQRLFSPLMLGQASTDDDGIALIEIPPDLPGDPEGNLHFFARIEEDHYKYSNVRSSLTQDWGIPVSDMDIELPRALWSPHPPLWMLITFNVLMLTVWGHYLVIFVKLNGVKKDGKNMKSSDTDSAIHN